MDLNNVNVGGFIFSNDYYSLSSDEQNKYSSYIIFDVSTDEIIVNNHSFGFSKKAKEEIENDELVITQGFLLLNTSFNNFTADIEQDISLINKDISDLETVLIHHFVNIDISINDLYSNLNDVITQSDSLTTLINDVSDNIIKQLIDDEIAIVNRFINVDVSIKDLYTNLNNVITENDVKDLINDVSADIMKQLEDDELVIASALTQLDTSVTLINESLEPLITNISTLNDITNNHETDISRIDNDLEEFETVLIQYLDKADTSINLLQEFKAQMEAQISLINASINTINTSVNLLEA